MKNRTAPVTLYEAAAKLLSLSKKATLSKAPRAISNQREHFIDKVRCNRRIVDKFFVSVLEIHHSVGQYCYTFGFVLDTSSTFRRSDVKTSNVTKSVRYNKTKRKKKKQHATKKKLNERRPEGTTDRLKMFAILLIFIRNDVSIFRDNFNSNSIPERYENFRFKILFTRTGFQIESRD